MKRISSFISVLLLLSCWSCTNDLGKVRVPENEERRPTAITYNVKILYSEKGKLMTEVTAPVRHDYTGESVYSEMPEGIKATFFDERNRPQTVLTAGYALLREKEDLIFVRDSVVIVNDKGETLKTEALTLDNKTKMVYTHELVTITKKDKMFMGEGLIARVDFPTYDMFIPSGWVKIHENE